MFVKGKKYIICMGDYVKIEKNVKLIIEKLEAAGFEAFAVGGCVRDSLLGLEPMDWDLTTNARPEQIKQVFTRTVDTGIKHGTVSVLIDNEAYEVTTYRTDGEYEDHRHPKNVSFTPNLREDLCRRDFTINAMAYSEKTGIVDLFGGKEDLEKGVIVCVGDPKKRFDEDALRMLRAIRFAGKLGFEIEEKTFDAIVEKSSTIVNVSAERIRTEISKLICSKEPMKLMLAQKSGLTSYFLPEFDKMVATPQNNPHHLYNVAKHSIEVIRAVNDQCKEKKIEGKYHTALAYAALLHDVGKPACKSVGKDNVDHFYNHNIAGEKMARDILSRLKFDNETIKLVSKLIFYHDERHEKCYMNGKYSEKGKVGMRRLMSKIGKENVPYLFILQRADLLGQSEYKRKEKLDRLDAAIRAYDEIVKAQDAVMIKELDINGRDLLDIGYIGEGIGKELEALLDLVLVEPEKNERSILLQKAKNDIG